MGVPSVRSIRDWTPGQSVLVAAVLVFFAAISAALLVRMDIGMAKADGESLWAPPLYAMGIVLLLAAGCLISAAVGLASRSWSHWSKLAIIASMSFSGLLLLPMVVVLGGIVTAVPFMFSP
jgi:hypothetical protein